ncbi:MAG: NAD-dependent epimerase/dehydratase family protein [Pseudomonadota bacterium]
MTRILITGGTGRLGHWVVRELCTDHEIVVASLEHPGDRAVEGVQYCTIDLADPSTIDPVLVGVTAIVHLAAIPSPIGRDPEFVFANNMTSTFNIVEAAVRNNIGRIVYSGSGSTLGFAFQSKPMIPDYMPMDEEHPARPQDAYGLSKWLGEEILAAATRRTDMTTISLRPTTVVTPEDYNSLIPALLDKPGGIGIFAYVDARDYAQAVRLALEIEGITHDRFFITADDALSREPLSVAFPRRFPGSESVAAKLTGHEGPITSAKAKRMLGYKPNYSWRSLVPTTHDR